MRNIRYNPRIMASRGTARTNAHGWQTTRCVAETSCYLLEAQQN